MRGLEQWVQRNPVKTMVFAFCLLAFAEAIATGVVSWFL